MSNTTVNASKLSRGTLRGSATASSSSVTTPEEQLPSASLNGDRMLGKKSSKGDSDSASNDAKKGGKKSSDDAQRIVNLTCNNSVSTTAVDIIRLDPTGFFEDQPVLFFRHFTTCDGQLEAVAQTLCDGRPDNNTCDVARDFPDGPFGASFSGFTNNGFDFVVADRFSPGCNERVFFFECAEESIPAPTP